MKTTLYYYKIFFSIIFVACSSMSYAQEWGTSNTKEEKKSAYVHEVDLSSDNTDTGSNTVITDQFGSDNMLHIQQNGQQFTKAVQIGDYNNLNVLQEGLENSILTAQYGYGNSIDLDISGSDNRFGYVQVGNDNSIEHRSVQSNGTGAIIQLNDNNQLKLDETGGNYLNGIKVQQNGGMRVNITTSLKVD